MTRFLDRSARLTAVALAAMASALSPAQAGEVKIGAVLAITGPASFLGEPEEKTLKMYVDDINAKGGVNGDKITLVVYDDGADANKARTFAQRLIEEDKVIAQVGGTTTGSTMAMVPVFEEAKKPFISLAGAVVIIDPVKKYVFKTPHTDKMACEKIFTDLKKRNLTKIGLISGQGGFEKSMREQCLAVAPKFGLEILGDESYGPKDTDMTPQLTNIKGKPGLHAIVVCGFGQGPAILTRNYKQLGLTMPLYHSHGVASKKFIELAGDAAEGIRLPAAALLVADKLPDSNPQKKVVVAYTKTFEEKAKQEVSTFGGHAYDGLMILIEAMKRAGSNTDTEKIRSEIENTKGFIGTGGIVNMSPADHMGLDLTAFRMLEVAKGDWKLVE